MEGKRRKKMGKLEQNYEEEKTICNEGRERDTERGKETLLKEGSNKNIEEIIMIEIR